jgi:glucokinase
MANYLGIEIGGTKLQLLLADEQLHPIKTFRFEIDRNAGAKGIRSSIETVIADINCELLGVGVGFGGPINRHSGTVFKSYHIEGWADFSIKEWLETLCNCQATIENDANVAALAEALHGAGKTFSSVYYVTLGSGVGSGLVIERNIFHGAYPGEAEFGHVRLNKSGVTVQERCSGWAVNEKILQAVNNDPNSILTKLTRGLKKDQSKILLEAIHQGDQSAEIILDETVDDLCFALSHPIHLFHPETIILGGGLSLIGEPLRLAIEIKIKKYIMDAFQPGPIIQLSTLGENAVPIGAVAMAINN